ncbi:hypothetical protein EMIT0357P_10197 [Pseudomonas marginalis]
MGTPLSINRKNPTGALGKSLKQLFCVFNL